LIELNRRVREEAYVPDPILVSIAAALASKGAATIYDVVKAKFAGNRAAIEALESADGATPESPLVHTLSEHLEQAEQDDKAFSEQLRNRWHEVSIAQDANDGGINNLISGSVSGNVIQARDINGGITFS
jgi:hypothetical protein